jgi:hypothetical protein
LEGVPWKGLPDKSPTRPLFSGVALTGFSVDHFVAPFLVLALAKFQHPKSGAYFLTNADYRGSFRINTDFRRALSYNVSESSQN